MRNEFSEHNQMRDSRLTRRTFIGGPAAAFLFDYSLRPAQSSALRIGLTDWALNLGADPAAVSKAVGVGFEGVPVSFGGNVVEGKMPADDPEIIATRVLRPFKTVGAHER